MASLINAEYPILGTHLLDLLSIGTSETLTVGNTTSGTSIRVYDNNNPSSGYLLSTSNNAFSIYKDSGGTGSNTCIGIGTSTPNSSATLHVQGTILTSNIGTYNENNTLYFNNQTLSGINNIFVNNTVQVGTPAVGDVSSKIATTAFVNNVTSLPNLASIGSSSASTTTINGTLAVNNIQFNGSSIIQNSAGSIGIGAVSQTFNTTVTTAASNIVIPATGATTYVALFDSLTGAAVAKADANLTFNAVNNVLNVNSGSVGIGSTTPVGALDVVGNINATGTVSASVFTGTFPENSTSINTSNILISDVTSSTTNYYLTTVAGSNFQQLNTSTSLYYTPNPGIINILSSGVPSTQLQYGSLTLANNTTSIQATNTGMTYTAPSTNGHIFAVDTLENNVFQINSNAITTSLPFTSTNTATISGNVGIGTAPDASSPLIVGNQGRLRISSGNPTDYTIIGTNDTNNSLNTSILLYGSNVPNFTGSIYYNTTSTGAHVFSNVGIINVGEKMRITPAGFVGIGTTNPTSNLTVNGNVAINGLLSYTNYAFRFLYPNNTLITRAPATSNYLNFNTSGSSADSTMPYITIDPTSGAFRAPVSGIYSFTATLNLDSGSGLTNTYRVGISVSPTNDLLISSANFTSATGVNIKASYASESSATRYMNQTISCIVRCNQNDYVKVFIGYSTTVPLSLNWTGPKACTLSGMLLTKFPY